MSNQLTVFDLVTKESYCIPLYQRNFAWTYDEIEQLLYDVADAYEEDRSNYYIGTLVVSEDKGNLNIIDGQQRSTALNLIALVLKNSYDDKHLQAVPNLDFQARKQSSDNLRKLYIGGLDAIEEDCENEITRGYRDAEKALKRLFEERIDASKQSAFINYLFENVIIFRNNLSPDLDLNLYFERFNSRGEQLEAHEIIKAQLMAKFGNDQESAQKFAKIWDACADFNKPVISFFTKKTKHSHGDSEREHIFPADWISNYTFRNRFSLNVDSKLSQIINTADNKHTLIDAISDKFNIETAEKSFSDDESVNYVTITNFQTFLYYVYYITFGNVAPRDIQLDDKKLLETFGTLTDTNGQLEGVIDFARNMLSLKFIFDNLIIRMSQENSGNGRRRENEWFLQKVYRTDVNQKSRGHRYVQYRFDKNSFETCNDEILLLQSMFAVTFTANRDSRWLYEVLRFLHENIEKLHEADFGEEFRNFLQDMAVRYAKERLYNEDGRLKSYQEGMPVYGFNFIDYVLWKNREVLKQNYKDVAFEDFKFAYRRSVEHWYPQNQNTNEMKTKVSQDELHSIGNLCIITDSQNSKFSNLDPGAKFRQWKDIFNRQSLKLQIMAARTEKNDWDSHSILDHAKEVESLIRDYLNTFSAKD